MKEQKQISERSYKAAGFIERYQKLVTDVVIPWQEKILNDEAPDTVKSHAIANFINAGNDNGSVKSLRLDTDSLPEIASFSEELKAYTLSVKAVREAETDKLYTDTAPGISDCVAVAIPYYTWSNRGETEMRVWMNR